MGRIAFVFSGQGDQHPGMGKDFYEKYSVAKDVFEMCESIRKGTKAQCFDGTDEQLQSTINTQPCLFAMELAAASVLIEKGIKPDVVAGFSLGEVVAATVAGVVDNQTGFSLVCKRAELMQQASENHAMQMAAVVKLSNDQVIATCDEFEGVYPVNFNCPGQVTVSAIAEQMTKFSARVKEIGGRAIPLKVKGGFHCPYMAEASKAFLKVLDDVNLEPPKIVLYSNYTAKPYGDNQKELLSKQICSPVLWEQSVRNMILDGIDTFIEVGPGRTLSNMIKKIDSTVKVYSVLDLENIISEVSV